MSEIETGQLRGERPTLWGQKDGPRRRVVGAVDLRVPLDVCVVMMGQIGLEFTEVKEEYAHSSITRYPRRVRIRVSFLYSPAHSQTLALVPKSVQGNTHAWSTPL